MMENKPTPPKREFISNSQSESYRIPESGFQPYSKEILSNDNNYGVPDFQRSEEISFKDGDEKQISITLQDHDKAIIDYIKNTILNSTVLNGIKRDIPVIYSSPERWKSMQKDGFYRDKNGKFMIPVISIKRDSFGKDRTLGNKLDANKVNNYYEFNTTYSKRNSYDNFSALNGVVPQKEKIISVVPDYINIEYTIFIFADYMEHMNLILESFNYASDSYWGDKNIFQFRAFIDSFPTSVQIESNNDRAVRCDFKLKVKGYIIPETLNKYISSQPQKTNLINRVKFEEKIK